MLMFRVELLFLPFLNVWLFFNLYVRLLIVINLSYAEIDNLFPCTFYIPDFDYYLVSCFFSLLLDLYFQFLIWIFSLLIYPHYLFLFLLLYARITLKCLCQFQVYLLLEMLTNSYFCLYSFHIIQTFDPIHMS